MDKYIDSYSIHLRQYMMGQDFSAHAIIIVLDVPMRSGRTEE